MGRKPPDLIVHFGRNILQEIRRRRVEIAGEHEILPDEQTEPVAQIVEPVGLIEAAPPDADHVHVRVDRRAKQVLDTFGRYRDIRASAGIQLAPRQKISRPFTRKAKRLPASSLSVTSSIVRKPI